jgi:hypothetical protein
MIEKYGVAGNPRIPGRGVVETDFSKMVDSRETEQAR